MTSYSFNGFTIAGSTIELASVGLLMHGATAFQALVVPVDPNALSRDIPAKVICSNLRLIEGDQGASHRVRAPRRSGRDSRTR
jgi:hypothetical protein